MSKQELIERMKKERVGGMLVATTKKELEISSKSQ